MDTGIIFGRYCKTMVDPSLTWHLAVLEKEKRDVL
jgi:hypothetical protein